MSISVTFCVIILGLSSFVQDIRGVQVNSSSPVATLKDDNPVINNTTINDVPVTEINPPSSPPPEPSTSVSTTVTPPPTTKPTTPDPTTSTPAPTTTSKPSTTPKPSTTSKPSTTPKPSTTSKPVPPSPTTSTPNSTTAIPPHGRKFDGPSFVGGIVLALGLVAIGFVAFKFYKARTELNYHTL